MITRLFLAGLSLSLAANVASGQSHGLKLGPQPRLEVLPVLFVPSDNKSVTPQAIQKISSLVYAHLELAQRRYKELLQTDTFKIADGKLDVYRSSKPHSYFVPPGSGAVEEAWLGSHPAGPDAHNYYLKELLEWRHDNRYDSRFIYLVLYARPAVPGKDPWFFAGARPFNGLPNSGGGAVALELSSLLSDTPYPFQATLAHELGHAFGLSHASGYGYHQLSHGSVMASNPRLAGKGLTPHPGILTPEDYFVLSKNKLAFPNFEYHGATFNPLQRKMDRTESCYQPAISAIIGEFRPPRSGAGFEMFFDGARISDGEAEFESFKNAKNACRLNKSRRPGVKAECRYHGAVFDPGPAPRPPDLAGAWCDNFGQPLSVAQSGDSLTFTNVHGDSSRGHFESNDFAAVYDMVVADDWEGGMPGYVSADGKRLDWANGSFALRGKCRQ